jgi:hypothetical protein
MPGGTLQHLPESLIIQPATPGEMDMPYIAPSHRQELDTIIAELAGKIVQEADKLNHEAAFAGLLNYTCTCLALQIVRQRFGRLRYWLIALISGTFHNIADEFYRRLAGPYEDRQISTNGDVNLYAEYLAEIKNEPSLTSN